MQIVYAKCSSFCTNDAAREKQEWESTPRIRAKHKSPETVRSMLTQNFTNVHLNMQSINGTKQ